MKRRPMSARSSRKTFRRGTKVNRKNHMMAMRGGIRF